MTLQFATQQFGDDCRRDANACIERGRINSRDMIEYLCGTDDIPRNYKLVLLYPGDEFPEGWYVAVYDREVETLAECAVLPFLNRFAIRGENNSGETSQWRLLSDTAEGIIIGDAVDSGIFVPPSDEIQLSATAVVQVGELPRRLQEELFVQTLAETVGEVESGVDEESGPICATNFATASILGQVLSESQEPMAQSSLIGGETADALLIEKGSIRAGRAIDVFFEFGLE